ncbi:hypothetical protein F2Q69_00022668 [Brassica cretica]|uniref:Uncharacterized protein n=1 Tax=Brassica cretica TaxID=69181 RepID=A0A3N6RKN8_BRACR|nr:hypothetical protein F2Q69_00022668 [Brassica cretica]
MTDTSSDTLVEESIDTELFDAIDATHPETGKFLLTNLNDKEVVLGEPKGQKCNARNQIIKEQGAAIPGKINTNLINEMEHKLPLQDYLDPGRTYSNRSAIKLPENYIRGFENLAKGKTFERMDVERGNEATTTKKRS